MSHDPFHSTHTETRFPALSPMLLLGSLAATQIPEGYVTRSLVMLSPVQNDHQLHHHQHHQLHVPLASLSFVDRNSHSPRQLLQSTVDDHDTAARRETVVGFCGCTAARGSSAEANVLLQELQALNIPTAPTPTTTTPCAVDASAFYLDTHVGRCQQLQFAVVFEDPDLIDTRGHISDRIVSAFLAGSIPIYYGHSATVAWLFNRNAFIDCRAFGSMSKCAAHVAQIQSSVDLYEAMRREPPVVNSTAFSEVFSWHPDVAAEMAVRGEATMTTRLLLSQ